VVQKIQERFDKLMDLEAKTSAIESLQHQKRDLIKRKRDLLKDLETMERTLKSQEEQRAAFAARREQEQ